MTHDTDPRQFGDVWNLDPTWSPNGALLAYGHINGQGDPANNGLYVSRSDGTGVRLLVAHAYQPAWQPRP